MKAFKLGFILLCVGAAVSGCAARETHRIRVVPRFVPEVISGGPAELGASTAAVAPTVSPTFSAKGVWLYRLVETPTQGGGTSVTSLEMIFCPPIENDLSKCRVGRVWSADIHPMGTTAQ
jgi:hypothetical protein